jgi:hypothetical protein
MFHVFVAEGAEHVGDPIDAGESEGIAWVAVDKIRRIVAAGEIIDGLSLTALLWALALSEI